MKSIAPVPIIPEGESDFFNASEVNFEKGTQVKGNVYCGGSGGLHIMNPGGVVQCRHDRSSGIH